MGNKNPMFGKKSNEKQIKALEIGRKKQLLSLPKVYCHQNKKTYNTVTEASRDLGFARSSVSNVLTGFRKDCRGYTFEYIGN